MRLSSADLVHLIAAGTLLLATAHGFGRLFARFRQPRVAGEPLGGLLLGPTLFGLLAPGGRRRCSRAAPRPRSGSRSPTSSACCC